MEQYDAALSEFHNNTHTAKCYGMIGMIYEDIGSVLDDKGQPGDALIGNGKAFCLWLLGENLIDTANRYKNIGMVLEKKGQYDEALVSYREALAIF
jgi:tetratricopeptide (TPR) repeat protein